MDWRSRIEVNPEVLLGKPVVKGTRLGVGFLLELCSNGWSVEQILENYPQLTNDDLRAVFAYGAARIKNESVFPLEFAKSN